VYYSSCEELFRRFDSVFVCFTSFVGEVLMEESILRLSKAALRVAISFTFWLPQYGRFGTLIERKEMG
jgi:hypothetical protein